MLTLIELHGGPHDGESRVDTGATTIYLTVPRDRLRRVRYFREGAAFRFDGFERIDSPDDRA